MPVPPASVQPRHAHPRGTRARRWRLRAAALAGLAAGGLVSSCRASDSVAAPATDIGGAYTLRIVGRDTLPATVFDSTFVEAGVRVTIAITGGTMTLGPAGGYIFNLTYTYVVNGLAQPVTPLGDVGTYTRAGSTLVFTSIDGGGSMNGTLAGGDLTVAQDLLADGSPLMLMYRK